MDTNAKSERKSGDYGTVEQQANPAHPTKYVSSGHCPSKRPTGTAITAQAAAPSAAKRAKIAQIEAAQSQPERKRKQRATAQWAEYVGHIDSQDLYGIKVKVRGISAETYWLPYSKAAMLWTEVTGEDIKEVL